MYSKRANNSICCLLLIQFIFLICTASGQGKKTIVADALTKKILPDASVHWVQNKKLVHTTKTNQQGAFQILIAEAFDQLQVSYIGYQNYFIQYNGNPTNFPDTIFLQQYVQSKSNVTVTVKKPLLSMTAGKITMNISESGMAVGNSAWETLQIAPGVHATEEGSVTLNSKSVTIYIDGRPSYLTGDQLKTLLSNMPASTIDKIELISNPSAKYQANGAAIINIKTNKLKNYGTNGSFTTILGTSRYFRTTNSLDLNYRKNKVNLYGGLNFSKNRTYFKYSNIRILNTFTQTIYAKEPRTEWTRNYNEGIKLGMDLDLSKKTTIGFLVHTTMGKKEKNGLSHSIISLQQNSYDSIIHTNTENHSSTLSPSINIFFKTTFDSTDKELLLNADFFQYTQQWEENITAGFKNASGTSIRTDELRRNHSPTILQLFSATADYSQSIKKWKLESGIKTTMVNTDNNIQWESLSQTGWQSDALRTNYFIYKEYTQAAYAGLYRTVKKFDLESMIRVEQTNVKGNSITLRQQFNKQYHNWFPSLSMQYNINPKNQLSLSYRKSINRPYYNYVNPFKIFKSQYNYFEGNPDLDPSFTHSIELSHSYQYALFTTISYSYTDQYSASFARQDTNTKILTYFPSNYKYAKTAQCNITFSKQLTPKHFINTNLTTSYFKAAYPGIIPKKNTTSITTSFYYAYSVKKQGLKLEVYTFVGLPYHDGFYYQGLNSFCNIAANKEILKKRGTLRMNCTNIFGVNNLAARTEIGDVYLSNRIFRDSRTINLNFTYKFGNKNIRQSKNRRSSISSETNRVGG